MPETANPRATWSGAADWILPLAAVTLVFVMLVPLPGFVLDLLLATSITAPRVPFSAS